MLKLIGNIYKDGFISFLKICFGVAIIAALCFMWTHFFLSLAIIAGVAILWASL